MSSTVLLLLLLLARFPLICLGQSLASNLPQPRCEDFSGLRVFMYHLPSAFHHGLFDEFEKQAQASGSSCDFMRNPCDEDQWAFKFSTARQRGAEVILLRKFWAGLSCAEVQTTKAEEADVFVVPYLAGLDCFLAGHQYRCPRRWNEDAKDLFQLLVHYSPATRHRHLFLATADLHSLPLQLQAQPLLISHGAAWGDLPGQLVSPSAVADVFAQSPQESQDEDAKDLILFWLAVSATSTLRRALVIHLREFDEAFPEAERSEELGRQGRVVIHHLERSQQLPPPKQFASERSRAVFCPVPPGETSGGLKRLLDALLAGCLPVVVAFRTALGSGRSWWRHDGPPIEWSLPFSWEIDWPRLVVEVSEEHFWQGRLAQQCLGLSRKEELSKRAYLAEVRGLLRYDLRGGSRDAFSLLLEGLRRAVEPKDGLSLVCSMIPRRARHVGIYLEETRTVEKRWSNSFAEISCSDPSLWEPASAFWNLTATLPVLFQQHSLAAARSTAGQARYVHVYGRFHRELSDLPEQRRLLSAARFAVCFPDVPVACHDSLVPVDVELVAQLCSQAPSTPPAGTRCRLLAEVAPIPALLSSQPWVQLELVMMACSPLGDVGNFLADDATFATRLTEAAGLAVHAALYASCDDSGGATPLLLEHAMARMYQVREGVAVPDLLLISVLDLSAQNMTGSSHLTSLEAVLDMFAARFASSQLGDSTGWLYVVEGPPGRSWPCKGHDFMSRSCQSEVVPQALIFPSRLLRHTGLQDWEAAAAAGPEDSREQLLLLQAILQDGAVEPMEILLEPQPYEEDLSPPEAVRAYEAFNGSAYLSLLPDHRLRSCVACLENGGFYFLFDWQPSETLQDEGIEQLHRGLLADILGSLQEEDWQQISVLGVCMPGRPWTPAEILQAGWHQLLKHVLEVPPGYRDMPVPAAASVALQVRDVSELQLLWDFERHQAG